jgi:hypothetical protein
MSRVLNLSFLGRHIFISSLHNIYAYIYISFFSSFSNMPIIIIYGCEHMCTRNLIIIRHLPMRYLPQTPIQPTTSNLPSPTAIYLSIYLILINKGDATIVDGRLLTLLPVILPLRFEKEIFLLAMIAVLIFSIKGVVGGVEIICLRSASRS